MLKSLAVSLLLTLTATAAWAAPCPAGPKQMEFIDSGKLQMLYMPVSGTLRLPNGRTCSATLWLSEGPPGTGFAAIAYTAKNNRAYFLPDGSAWSAP